MEGIETPAVGHLEAYVVVSVGAPTWRGLKHWGNPDAKQFCGVSRCPDMEGIETSTCTGGSSDSYVSVGAPTWRGLKLQPVNDMRVSQDACQ